METSPRPDIDADPATPTTTPGKTTTSTLQPNPSNTTDSKMAAVMSATTLSPSLDPLQTSNLQRSSPPHSGSASPMSLSAKRSRSPLSIDLSNLPGLSTPAPPSNTLLITRLTNPTIFHPATLATIREHITSIAPLYSFSPLKSFARIIVSFYDEESAVKVRRAIDGTAFATDSIARCYYGEPTPIDNEKKYLERPDAGRLFFISPPPSPPVGWEMKMEDPPNKEVHAEDLAAKLSKLTGKLDQDPNDALSGERFTAEELQQQVKKNRTTGSDRSRSSSPITRQKRTLSALSEDGQLSSGSPPKMRSRSSTLIYDPKLHGDSPALPAVMLETEDDSEVELDTDRGRPPMAHTARPPVELMK